MAMPGQVYDLTISAEVGPWSRGERHPGVVVSQSVGGPDSPVVVLPLTGTRPSSPRHTHVELDKKCGDLDPPLWVLCEYPTTISGRSFDRATKRGVIPRDKMAQIKHKLGWLLGTGLQVP